MAKIISGTGWETRCAPPAQRQRQASTPHASGSAAIGYPCDLARGQASPPPSPQSQRRQAQNVHAVQSPGAGFPRQTARMPGLGVRKPSRFYTCFARIARYLVLWMCCCRYPLDRPEPSIYCVQLPWWHSSLAATPSPHNILERRCPGITASLERFRRSQQGVRQGAKIPVPACLGPRPEPRPCCSSAHN